MSAENRFNAVSPDNRARIREYSLLKTAILLHKSRENTDSLAAVPHLAYSLFTRMHLVITSHDFFKHTNFRRFFFHKSVCASTRQHKPVHMIENFPLLFWLCLHSRLDRIITAAMSHTFNAAANYFLIRGGPIPLSAQEFY